MGQIMPEILDMVGGKNLNNFAQICKIVDDRFGGWKERALGLVKQSVSQPYFDGIVEFSQLNRNENYVHRNFTNDLLISS